MCLQNSDVMAKTNTLKLCASGAFVVADYVGGCGVFKEIGSAMGPPGKVLEITQKEKNYICLVLTLISSDDRNIAINIRISLLKVFFLSSELNPPLCPLQGPSTYRLLRLSL